MDFFNLFNHPNFNSANLNGSGFNPTAPLLCGGGSTPCSPTNNVVTTPNDPGASTGFGQASAVNVADGARELQYTLRFTF
jgi:hypothetical protein